MPPFSIPDKWEEVNSAMELYNFILAVGASIVAYYICKWLDGQGKGD